MATGLREKNVSVWLGVLSLLMTPPDLTIASDSACPAASAIVAELGPLVPRQVVVAAGPDLGADAPQHAEVRKAPTGWVVTRRGRDGGPEQQESVKTGLRCADAAREIAVILAAWEFQGRPSLPSVFPARPVPPAPAPILPVAPPPSPAVTAVATERATAPGAATAPARWALGLGAGGVLAASSVAPSLVGEVTWGRRNGGGLRLGAGATGTQTLTVGTGEANWSRASLSLGGTYATRGERYGGLVRGDLVAGWWSLGGSGFATNLHGAQRLLGAEVALRGTRGLGAGELWLEAAVGLWPGTHTVEVAGAAGSRSLPTADVSLRGGVDFSFGE